MKLHTLRQTFLDYFADKGHTIVPSSSLVPANDKTLLFTNAGMVQFKDTFTGSEKRDYSRATSSQRCLRAGGKHNDLENVGYTARHHTFFEMLGNFSFGDYFKEDAIRFSWSLITEHFNLPADKLWVTVFEEDDEAYDIWANMIGFPEARISRIGAKDNFWQMGDTGPCGPCSEVFYDHGEAVWGGPPGTPEEDSDRFVEFWNLVFMQYNRHPDATLEPLPKPSVDTGMGLERMAAILQGVHSNYEIDLFVSLIDAAARATNTSDKKDNSLKVIADHIRAIAFLIADGVLPSNEGRGYVLRRIIRRAARHGHKLGYNKPFIHTLLSTLQFEMGDAYPELYEKGELIKDTILDEENRFAKTLDDGMKILQNDLSTGGTLSGEMAFKLYDTYGFPIDLTIDVAREHEMLVDIDRYDDLLAAQKARSQSASTFKSQTTLATDKQTDFIGYTSAKGESRIAQLFVDNKSVDSISAGQQAIVVLDRSPFYGESGGQVGDIGTLSADNATFRVTDTQKQGNTFLHFGDVTGGSLHVGDTLHAEIDHNRRDNIKRNHSATHLLHHALRAVLGKSVEQKGSLVAPDRLRFDFTYNKPMTEAELREVEHIANTMILANEDVNATEMSIDAAKDKGAMALFGEKYGDVVRVIEMGESIELCGGTHVARTGDIGQVIIVSESGVSAGVRRIEAVTGWGALNYHRGKHSVLMNVMESIKATSANVEQKVAQLLNSQKDLQKQVKVLKQRALTSGNEFIEAQLRELNSLVDELITAPKNNENVAQFFNDNNELQQHIKELTQSLLSGNNDVGQVREVAGVKVLTLKVKDFDVADLRDLADKQRDKQQADLVVIASANGDKVKLVASVAKASTDKLHAGKIIGEVAKIVDGKGGGRPDFAQAGGGDVNKIDDALTYVDALVRDLVK